MRQVASLAVIFLLASACESGNRPASEGASATGGTIVISSAGEPDVLFPPLIATTSGAQIADLIYDRLAEIGDSLNTVGDHGFEPRLARSWSWATDSLSIQFHLDPDAKWHDGTPVRASDVASTFTIYRDSATASPSAPLIADIDSITAPDSMTAITWFSKRSPTQFFEAVTPMLVLPAHLLKDVRGPALRTSSLARTPVGSGRFRFVSWKAGSSVEVAADTGNYRGRPHVDRVIWNFAPDPNTALTRLVGGEADVLELTPPQLPQLETNKNIRTVFVPGLDYNFIQFNLRDPSNAARQHPLFGDRNLRRALTMAVDRQRIVESVYDSLAAPAIGPTVRAYPTTDTTLQEIPYSPENARRLLDSLGWRVTGRDSLRRRTVLHSND